MGKLKTKNSAAILPAGKSDGAIKKKVTFAFGQEVFKLKPVGAEVDTKETSPSNEPSPATNKSKDKKLLRRTQFKAKSKAKSSSTLINKLKDKSNLDSTKSDKYNSIKTDLIREIKSVDAQKPNETQSNKELNFVKRTIAPRLTNHLLKSILADKEQLKQLKETNTSSVGLKLDTKNSKISKKDKTKLKKQIWHEKIKVIQNEVKENRAKAKREKTVIVGDMKPMMESLLGDNQSAQASQNNNEKNEISAELITPESLTMSLLNTTAKNTAKSEKALSKKQKREQNQERELSKQIPRQSIRTKKSKEDLNLFSQLAEYKTFTSNPLEILKKHFNTAK